MTEIDAQDINDFHALTLIYRVEVTWIHPKLYINNNWWLSVNYEVKHSFITTHYSMKQSFLSRTDVLFQCARTSTIGARTSISQNTLQKLSEQTVWRTRKCSNEQTTRAHVFGSVVTCLLSLCLITCFKPYVNLDYLKRPELQTYIGMFSLRIKYSREWILHQELFNSEPWEL